MMPISVDDIKRELRRRRSKRYRAQSQAEQREIWVRDAALRLMCCWRHWPEDVDESLRLARAAVASASAVWEITRAASTDALQDETRGP